MHLALQYTASSHLRVQQKEQVRAYSDKTGCIINLLPYRAVKVQILKHVTEDSSKFH